MTLLAAETQANHCPERPLIRRSRDYSLCCSFHGFPAPWSFSSAGLAAGWPHRTQPSSREEAYSNPTYSMDYLLGHTAEAKQLTQHERCNETAKLRAWRCVKCRRLRASRALRSRSPLTASSQNTPYKQLSPRKILSNATAYSSL